MRITKYVFIVIPVLLLALFAVSNFFYTTPVITNSVIPLSAALEAMGTAPEQVTIHGWTILPKTEASQEELAALVDAAVKDLAFVNGKVRISQTASNRHKLVRADVTGDRYQAAVIAQIMYPVQAGSQPEVYLVINIDEGNPVQHNWHQKILQIMTDQGATCHISTCLTGWIDGRLEDGQLRVRLNQAFSAINASVHDTVSDFHYMSMSGYSPAVAESLTVNGKKVNVNMAMRYSPTDNRTYCIVGSPVITNEY